MFPDPEACLAYLEHLRWPTGFTCPSCGHADDPWRLSRGRLLCQSCRHQCTATSGTIFDKTRTPLTTWFKVAWHLTTAKNGLSAKALERRLGIHYRLAWMMLQRFRIAMVRADQRGLSGTIEVDETLVDVVQRAGNRGRGASTSVVVIAVEVLGSKRLGRVRMRHLQNASAGSLLPFIREAASPGAAIHTDGWSGYNGLSAAGYAHRKTVLSSSNNQTHVDMPAVHRVANLLKRWILGTHSGSITPEHLQAYLVEFTFRFNRRTSRTKGLAFRRLLEQSVVTPPATESSMTQGKHWKPK